MRIRIESDGTPPGTKVIDAETGKALDGITRIELEPLGVRDAIWKARLTVYVERVDVVADAEIHPITPPG